MDCLVTKLKEAVSDNSLDFLGKGKVYVHTSSTLTEAKNFGIRFTYSAAGSVDIVGDGYFTTSSRTGSYGKTQEFTEGSGNLYLSDGDYFILYDISKLVQINYSSQTGSSSAPKTYGVNLHDMRYAINLKSLYLQYTSSYGDVSDLLICSKLELLFLTSNSVTGSLKALCEAQKDVREAGKINVRGNGIITFDGENVVPNSSDTNVFCHFDGTGGYKITNKTDPEDAEETVYVDGGYVTPNT